MFENLNPEILETIYTYAIEIAFSILKVLIIFIIGKIVINYAMKAVKKGFQKWGIERSLDHFLTKFIRFILYIALILIIAQNLNFQLAALLAVLGAAGLAIGLALQGSLSNFAGGILILIFKPFKVDSIIDAQGHLGVVEKIDILHTRVRTFDNKVVVMPNGSLANANISNLNEKETRRIDMAIGVAYGSNIGIIRQIILDTLAKDERILEDPAPVVRFSSFGDSSLDLSVRCWVATDNQWPVYWENMEALNDAFNANEIEIPFPQRDIHMRTK
jgi:small conductance mechanosensitive channel